MILSWISFIILLTYILWTTTKYGIPESLSQTYYHIPKGFIFTLTIWICNFLIVPQAMDMTGDLKIIPFLGILGSLLVGAAPRVRDEDRTVHNIGAIVSAVFSQIFVAVYGNPWSMLAWIPALFLLAVSIKFDPRELRRPGLEAKIDTVRFVFWCEMVCYFTLYTSLLGGGV